MVFKCGIIGLPNVGKSTLFNILTDSSVRSENFPFCTIQANKGFMPILDIRLCQLSRIVQVNHVIHGNIKLIDIAGLIQGASCGEGLGNKFLNDISEVDMLLHIVRCFKKHDVYHINNEISPGKDIDILRDELILFDIHLCEHLICSLKKNKQYEEIKYRESLLKFLKKILIHLYERDNLFRLPLTVEEQKILKNYNFLTFKPSVYIANVGIDDSVCFSELFNIFSRTNIPYTALCVLLEDNISKSKMNNMISNINLYYKSIMNSKIFDIINIIYQVLKLKTFFTINKKSVKAWIVSKDTVAIEAANIIHTDFKKRFIRVQIVKYHDFISFQGWKESKRFGKMKIEGKEYLIQDGDVLNFLI